MISVDITYDNLETEHYNIKIASNKTNLHRVMTRFITYLGEDSIDRWLRLHESDAKVSLSYFDGNTSNKISVWYYKEGEPINENERT